MKGTGHGTGPMVVRDLHTILEHDRLRKKIKRAERISRRIDRWNYQKAVANAAAKRKAEKLAAAKEKP